MTTPAPADRDNLLGVCHALGGTFGFDPLILRLVLMLGLLLDFQATVAIYAVLGLATLAAALLAPAPKAGGSPRSAAA